MVKEKLGYGWFIKHSSWNKAYSDKMSINVSYDIRWYVHSKGYVDMVTWVFDECTFEKTDWLDVRRYLVSIIENRELW